ncbi:hypothetical protein BOX15_Mlig026563g1 [Macrostomum lignano]|uniref:Uncharacterized protein n=2 Tax=Macrostomum lignano TaxID=282301 RepID=A0A267DCW8_9PLAT|nr:hypothetical protein BOX15_Mlig026563g4 [Macrostomum lignano]PAA58168.1 hypothetical protein BOX15_Mlig026563g2 [Macrostomum lignano]PAA69501.1 hypothetical protein BOX15_Mlig026563g1 [Macrostomum lignano]
MADSESTSEFESETVDDPIQNLSNEKLYELLQNILTENEKLTMENEMFEKFLRRVEPNALGGGAGLLGSSTASQASQQEAAPTRGVRKRSRSKGSASERTLRLTAEQKCDIAQREIEELREELKRMEGDCEKIIDKKLAMIEETQVRAIEIKKFEHEFHRDVIVGGVSKRTGKVECEKFERHHRDLIGKRHALINKLVLKNQALKVSLRKLKSQLRQKEEMGDVLSKVDFDQLKIENSQYMDKIDEKNQELLKLKLMAGRTLQVLNQHKKKLAFLNKELDRIKADIQQRNDLLRRVDAEATIAEEERLKAEVINRRLREQLSDYKVPEVLEYVNCMADLYELQKKERIWDRKVDIAKMAVDRHQRIWKQIAKDSQK